jgi:hypothetical protein
MQYSGNSSSICNSADLCSLFGSGSVPRRLLDNFCWVACHNRVRRNILVTTSAYSANTGDEFGRCQLTFVTTLPAPTVLPRPIVTPGHTVTLPPIQTSSSIVMGFPDSGPFVPFLKSGSRGWVPEYKLTFGANKVLEPMETRQVSMMVQLKLMKTPSPRRTFVP